MSLRETMLAAVPPEEVVEVPGVGPVLVKGLSSAAYDSFLAAVNPEVNGKPTYNPENSRAHLVVRCAFDPESKERLFTNEDAKDVGALRSDVVNAVYVVAERLSAGPPIKEAEKN